MKSTVGINIRKLRKERGMTQEELAARLEVTSQAVSKWERGDGMPDTSLLLKLSGTLNASIDQLFGNDTVGRYTTFLDAYNREDYYWGVEPSDICYEILRRYPPSRCRTILEIGCGEGRDAVFFARNGYQVTAFDIVESGIEKVYKLANRCHVPVEAFCADMLLYDIGEGRTFDLIYSSRVLQNVPHERHAERIRHYQEHTSPGGVNVFSVFVDKPFIGKAPDEEKNVALWKTGELFSCYDTWYIDSLEEKVVDCNSSGIPHKHAIDTIFARKYETT